VVDLIDPFVVIIGILMILVARKPLSPFRGEDVVVIENPGQADMRILVKQGRELRRHEASGRIGEGRSVRAGVTYCLDDGRLIHVPESAAMPEPGDRPSAADRGHPPGSGRPAPVVSFAPFRFAGR